MEIAYASSKIEEFIRVNVGKFNGVVIGLSGGIDSTVVAYLAVRALGKAKVFGLCLPFKKQEYQSSVKVAKLLGINYAVAKLDSIGDAAFEYEDLFNEDLVKGNFLARIRMSMLYAVASKMKRLVIGTTNKSEYEVGYFTKWGDGAADLEPIIDLYKTELKELAKHLRVPNEYIGKVPSAELWEGQTDEKELGMNYEDLDKVLKAIDSNIMNVSYENLWKVQDLITKAEHKKEAVPKCKLKEV